MAKIKVLLLHIVYPLSISKYWKNALKRNPNIDLVDCGPYTSNWIPWAGGMNLDMKYAQPPTYPLPFKPNVGRVTYELVRAQLPEDWHPDVIMCVDAGINWTNKPSEGIVVTVGTDGHCLDYSHARAVSDYFFNMHPCYHMPGDRLISYAFDPGTHYAMSDVEKDTDAVFIGMAYERRKWVDRLRASGVSVIFENGPIFDEYRQLANRAHIGLNWSSMEDTNARVFETMGMKLCLVTNKTPDLDRYGFIDGTHYLGWTNLDEAVEKVLWAKNNPDWRDAIALAGYQKVTNEDWTYDRLVKDILKEVGFA